ncbi:MAG TPA: hypothetical protein VJH95_00590 [Candidatus Nanoarchaeia archaeon]|nr:hypothetical protein [Candidatus Nanoarchaeia archaeon]
MKTIALKENTFQMLEQLKEKQNAGSFDTLVYSLIKKEERIPDSLFGSLKQVKPFTRKEREEFWKDVARA